MATFRGRQGYSLVEVMLAVFLSTLLTSGIVSLLGGSVTAYRLQLNQGQLEESVSYARDVLVSHITQAGYQPEPWQNQAQFNALTDQTSEGGVSPGDQLGLQRRSSQNCYGSENPVTDSSGQPEFYLLETRFHVNADNNLAITCRYGPDASTLQTQINNFGLVENVESMQVLYAEDSNGDEIADGWVKAQTWQQESAVRAVKLGLLLSTQQRITLAGSEQITLLDETINTPADGRLRRTSTLTAAIRSRLR